MEGHKGEVNRMIKISNKKRLFVTTFITLMIIYSVYASLTPTMQASEVKLQQKGLSISNNVVGIDITKYTITAKEHPQDAYLGALSQENIKYTLQSNQSTLNIAYTFVDGNLQMIHVLEGTGLPITTKSATTPLEMAKVFLSSYQTYSKNSFYGNLGSMLNNIDANKNSRMTVGTIQLDVTASADSSTFRWTYVYDGIEAPVKCVVLSYSSGFLKYFLDNWSLYKIGSTSINLSEKEATDNGLIKAKSFSWELGSGNSTYEVKDFNATQAMVWETIFSNSLSAETARGRDPLTLYPMRHVWVSLDKFYLGNVYGIEVFFWADTKEVNNIQERFSTIDPPADLVATPNDNSSFDSAKVTSISVSSIMLPTLVTITLGFFVFWSGKMKLSKSKTSKIDGILLCILLSLLLLPISGVNAVNKSSLVWGSRSSGASDPGINGATWRKTSNELGNQSATASDISYSFSYYGDYSGAHNYQGPDSLKSEILGNISYTQDNSPFTAVVDFDHGVGNFYPANPGYFHFMFEDDIGTVTNSSAHRVGAPQNGVYDNEIYVNTGGSTSSQSNINFAFISACMSAALSYPNVNMPFGGGFYPNGGPEVGLPYAWTHRTVGWMGYGYPSFNTAQNMSLFGYSEPDDGNYCYIAFPYGSAGLSQTSIESGYTQTTYSSWVEEFFAYALMYDYSVHNALDEASLMCFTRDFGNTSLYKNFTSIWPMWLESEPYANDWAWRTVNGTNPETTNCTLAVYGNSNMHLSTHLTVYTLDQVSNPIVSNVYLDNEYVGTTGQYGEPVIIALPLGTHSIDVDQWLWDEYWQQYVFPLDVPYPLTVTITTSGTTITIYYAY
jgi:hypothetical protein